MMTCDYYSSLHTEMFLTSTKTLTNSSLPVLSFSTIYSVPTLFLIIHFFYITFLNIFCGLHRTVQKSETIFPLHFLALWGGKQTHCGEGTYYYIILFRYFFCITVFSVLLLSPSL